MEHVVTELVWTFYFCIMLIQALMNTEFSYLIQYSNIIYKAVNTRYKFHNMVIYSNKRFIPNTALIIAKQSFLSTKRTERRLTIELLVLLIGSCIDLENSSSTMFYSVGP